MVGGNDRRFCGLFSQPTQSQSQAAAATPLSLSVGDAVSAAALLSSSSGGEEAPTPRSHLSNNTPRRLWSSAMTRFDGMDGIESERRSGEGQKSH